jgi:transcription initiation factor IIE alpha subunit
MPTPNSKRNFKIRARKKPSQTHSSKKHTVALITKKNQTAAPSAAKPLKMATKKPNMDIIVRRSSYSKAARAAVLANATARQKLIEMGGENTIDVIREFDNDMSDEELAKKTGIKPSEVRVVLNRLHNKGVFSYTRVRDRDSGWYSYIWRMNEGRLREVGCGNGGRGETTFNLGKEGYCCQQCSPGKMVDFADAVDAQFRCSCGSSLEFVDARRAARRQDGTL